MSNANFFFFSQQRGKTDDWKLHMSTERARVMGNQPAFTTVLELSTVPEDNDWSKVRYRGPFYADFDAGDDIERVCEEFKNFLAKLTVEYNFDLTQASIYASGSKGFHIEVPAQCFMEKPPATGTAWLPYIYRQVAESLIVDTLDLNVYTGKRGRQWRTVNVRRDNGCYKVPLTVDEALGMTPELYRELIKEPRVQEAPTPPTPNTALVLLFARSKDKVAQHMRHKQKRVLKANEILDPWREAKKTPPTLERLMSGQDISDRAGFQAIAMQLAIYAVSVGMAEVEFLDRCRGLVENHVSDGVRYNSHGKRRDELSRMFAYMAENNLYDFEVDPLVRLLKPGTDASDLGVMLKEDLGDTAPAPAPASAPAMSDEEDGDAPAAGPDPTPTRDLLNGLRRGFFMNADGMFRSDREGVMPLCRATFRKVEAYYDVEKKKFCGYEFDIVVAGRIIDRVLIGSEKLTSALRLRDFLAQYQISFQGGDFDANALMDIMQEKAARNGKVHSYAREGLFVINHPEKSSPTPVICYLAKDAFLSNVPEDHEDYFSLRYRPEAAASAFNVDIHWAPELDESLEPYIEDVFSFNKPGVVLDLLGWFTACHYRSLYLHLFQQFPLLQVYGLAGNGKSKSLMLLAHMHWYLRDRVRMPSALSFTPYSLDTMVSTSTSAPLLIDEYKPRELRAARGKFEKLKDIFKASYIGNDIANRGTLDKNEARGIGIDTRKATAPVAFCCEAVEMETALVERCVIVEMSEKGRPISCTNSFDRLQEDPQVLSALGRKAVELGLRIDLSKMRGEVKDLMQEVRQRQPNFGDPDARKLANRIIYNRALVLHGFSILRRIVQRAYGSTFDTMMDRILSQGGDQAQMNELLDLSNSEINKVISRMGRLSRERDKPYEVMLGKHYLSGDGFVELKVDACFTQYRLYCATVRETALFDSVEAFQGALFAHPALDERNVVGSSLRDEGSNERIVRLNSNKLKREGIQTFRD